MNKKQIINKIVNDLPSRDLRSRMTNEEWYGWFEECWDKAINYTHLRRESKSFTNLKTIADIQRLYPNQESYGISISNGLQKFYVNNELIHTKALIV